MSKKTLNMRSLVPCLTYLGSVFGSPVDWNETSASFGHASLPEGIWLAVTLAWIDGDLSILISDDLPPHLWYQMHGFASLNNIKVVT